MGPQKQDFIISKTFILEPILKLCEVHDFPSFIFTFRYPGCHLLPTAT